MSKYSKKGLYSAYDKNNKEREALDYYSTPTEEVTNILEILNINDLLNSTILEPCCGGGHMIEGILKYGANKIIGTDIKNRGYINSNITLTYGLDYLSDDYPYSTSNYIIMN